jgi:di/tricarboxylate transporter
MFVLLGGLKLWAQGAVPVDGTDPGAGISAGKAGKGARPESGGDTSDTSDAPGSSGLAGPSGQATSSHDTAPAPSRAPGTSTAPTSTSTLAPRQDPADTTTRLTPARIATLTALVALVVAVLGFDLDAGLTSITLAVILSTAWPDDSRTAVGQIAWSTVLLICGVLTYVGVLDEMGTIKWAGEGVGGIGVPLLAAVLLCYIGAIVSAFASSVGIMGALIPLAVPFLAQGEIGAVGMVAALAVSATVVDVSPFSTNGALVLAAAPDVDRERFFRQLMIYGGIVVAVVPVVVWLVLVVPGFG